MIGKHVRASEKSHHAGQTGIVVADYGNYLMIIADDQDYKEASKSLNWDKKVFQIDRRYYKEIKNA